jgi:hypothetical protein
MYNFKWRKAPIWIYYPQVVLLFVVLFPVAIVVKVYSVFAKLKWYHRLSILIGIWLTIYLLTA